MGLAINANLISANATSTSLADTQLNAGGLLTQTLARLSSGYVVGNGDNDSSAISGGEQAWSQSGGLALALSSAQESSTALSLASQSLSEIADDLNALQQLAAQAETGDISELQGAIDDLVDDIDRIATSGGKSGSSYNIQLMSSAGLGAYETDAQGITLQDVKTGGAASLENDPEAALEVIGSALDEVTAQQDNLRTFQESMLEASMSSLTVAVEGIAQVADFIRDSAAAAAATTRTGNQIETDADTAVRAQANTSNRSVLQLLR